jgi:hypothetical protein
MSDIESRSVLIGFLPLELLDSVVGSKNQRLIGNPDIVGNSSSTRSDLLAP